MTACNYNAEAGQDDGSCSMQQKLLTVKVTV